MPLYAALEVVTSIVNVRRRQVPLKDTLTSTTVYVPYDVSFVVVRAIVVESAVGIGDVIYVVGLKQDIVGCDRRRRYGVLVVPGDLVTPNHHTFYVRSVVRNSHVYPAPHPHTGVVTDVVVFDHEVGVVVLSPIALYVDTTGREPALAA